MTVRSLITIVIYMMVQAVLFGAGAVTVAATPALAVQAQVWIPVVTIVSFLIAVPVAWLIAPRLKARYELRAANRRARSRGADRSTL